MAGEEETVTFRALSKDEEGRKRVEKVEVATHNPDTLRYINKKMVDKGVQRMDRHPRDGLAIAPPPHKAGHGGKFTWEGPAAEIAESELSPVPAAIDAGDPNYDDNDDERQEAEPEGKFGDPVDMELANTASAM